MANKYVEEENWDDDFEFPNSPSHSPQQPSALRPTISPTTSPKDPHTNHNVHNRDIRSSHGSTEEDWDDAGPNQETPKTTPFPPSLPTPSAQHNSRRPPRSSHGATEITETIWDDDEEDRFADATLERSIITESGTQSSQQHQRFTPSVLPIFQPHLPRRPSPNLPARSPSPSTSPTASAFSIPHSSSSLRPIHSKGSSTNFLLHQGRRNTFDLEKGRQDRERRRLRKKSRPAAPDVEAIGEDFVDATWDGPNGNSRLPSRYPPAMDSANSSNENVADADPSEDHQTSESRGADNVTTPKPQISTPNMKVGGVGTPSSSVNDSNQALPSGSATKSKFLSRIGSITRWTRRGKSAEAPSSAVNPLAGPPPLHSSSTLSLSRSTGRNFSTKNRTGPPEDTGRGRGVLRKPISIGRDIPAMSRADDPTQGRPSRSHQGATSASRPLTLPTKAIEPPAAGPGVQDPGQSRRVSNSNQSREKVAWPRRSNGSTSVDTPKESKPSGAILSSLRRLSGSKRQLQPAGDTTKQGRPPPEELQPQASIVPNTKPPLPLPPKGNSNSGVRPKPGKLPLPQMQPTQSGPPPSKSQPFSFPSLEQQSSSKSAPWVTSDTPAFLALLPPVQLQSSAVKKDHHSESSTPTLQNPSFSRRVQNPNVNPTSSRKYDDPLDALMAPSGKVSFSVSAKPSNAPDLQTSNGDITPKPSNSKPLPNLPPSMSLGKAGGSRAALEHGPRRSSSGDAVTKTGSTSSRSGGGTLKIPASISMKQEALKRDLNAVRDFASSIEELKQFKLAYQSQLATIRDSKSKSRIHAVRELDARYSLWWECADLLVDLGGAAPPTVGGSPVKPGSASRSTNNEKPPMSSTSSVEYVGSAKEQRKKHSRKHSNPSSIGDSRYAGSISDQSSPTYSESQSSAGSQDLSQRQLILLNEILKTPDPTALPSSSIFSQMQQSRPSRKENHLPTPSLRTDSNLTLPSEAGSHAEDSIKGNRRPGRKFLGMRDILLSSVRWTKEGKHSAGDASGSDIDQTETEARAKKKRTFSSQGGPPSNHLYGTWNFKGKSGSTPPSQEERRPSLASIFQTAEKNQSSTGVQSFQSSVPNMESNSSAAGRTNTEDEDDDDLDWRSQSDLGVPPPPQPISKGNDARAALGFKHQPPLPSPMKSTFPDLTTGGRLALTPESIQPLLIYAKEVKLRVGECFDELKKIEDGVSTPAKRW